jgi:hypothetical protein
MENNSRISTAPVLKVAVEHQPWRRAFYSVEQIKVLASISRTTIYREAQAGRLKLSKLAGRTGAMDENFMAWLALGEEIKRSAAGTIEPPDRAYTGSRPRRAGGRHLPPPPRHASAVGDVNAATIRQGSLCKAPGGKE